MNEKTLKIASIILGIIGLADSIYLGMLKIGSDGIICLGGCDIVNSSKYSEIFGIPIAVFGAITYIIIIGLLVFKNKNNYLKENSTMMIFVLSLIGVIYSAYLTYLEIYVIHAICPYCVISAVVLVVLLVITIIRLKIEFEE